MERLVLDLDEVVGDDFLRLVEPELGEPVYALTFVGDECWEDDVVCAYPVRSDYEHLLAEVVDVPYLSAAGLDSLDCVAVPDDLYFSPWRGDHRPCRLPSTLALLQLGKRVNTDTRGCLVYQLSFDMNMLINTFNATTLDAAPDGILIPAPPYLSAVWSQAS